MTTDKTNDATPAEMGCPVTAADVDLFGPGAPEHWYEGYEILHREDPVPRLVGEGLTPTADAYILTKYDDIARVVKDPVRYPPVMSQNVDRIVERGIDLDESNNINAMMASIVTLRPTIPLWRSHRQELTDPWVGPGASRHQEMITATVDELIDDWIDRGSLEFVSEFARPLPQRVMASVLGFPREDVPDLERWGNAQVKAFVYGRGHRNILTEDEMRDQFDDLREFKEYVAGKVQERRAAPRDDMISFLCDVTYEALGRKLTDLEVNGVVYAMVIGGLETTQYAIAEQAQILCERPELFARLKENPDDIRQFTEESMRLRAPTQGLSTRMTKEDEVFQGVEVPAGSILHLRYAAANVDPEEFECPYDFDMSRKAVTRHMTFSQGPRVCPGATISRLEQTIAWQRLLDRIDSMAYGEGNTFLHQPGIMLGTLSLDLTFTKTV